MECTFLRIAQSPEKNTWRTLRISACIAKILNLKTYLIYYSGLHLHTFSVEDLYKKVSSSHLCHEILYFSFIKKPVGMILCHHLLVLKAVFQQYLIALFSIHQIKASDICQIAFPFWNKRIQWWEKHPLLEILPDLHLVNASLKLPQNKTAMRGRAQ